MNFDELIADVQGVIQDSSYTETTIQNLLNMAVLVVATGVILPGKFQLSSPPLPDLYTVGNIDTVVGEAICPLPADYNRDLIQVLNSNFESIPIIPSFRKFLSTYPTQGSGSVIRVAQNGKSLLYRNLPSTVETLTVHYYRVPDTLTLGEDVPDVIPSVLHRPLLVGYVCHHIFNEIEDGMEGAKANTNFWYAEYQKGLINLEILVGYDADPDYIDETLVSRIG